MKLKFYKLSHFLCLAILASSMNTANAAAVGNANGAVTLTITDIVNTTTAGDFDDLNITAEAGSSSIFTDFVGNSNATTSSFSNPANQILIGVGGGLEQNSDLATQASPAGTAEGDILTNGFIDLVNDSLTDTFMISFLLDYNLSVFSSIANIVLEDAGAVAELILLDETFAVDIDVLLLADAINGPTSDLMADTLGFTLTLDPDSSNQLFLELSLVANAQSDANPQLVPEPSILWLMLVGVTGYSVSKSKKIALASKGKPRKMLLRLN